MSPEGPPALQHRPTAPATHCRILNILYRTLPHVTTLHHTATHTCLQEVHQHRNTNQQHLQHTAEHSLYYTALDHTAPHFITLQHICASRRPTSAARQTSGICNSAYKGCGTWSQGVHRGGFHRNSFPFASICLLSPYVFFIHLFFFVWNLVPSFYAEVITLQISFFSHPYVSFIHISLDEYITYIGLFRCTQRCVDVSRRNSFPFASTCLFCPCLFSRKLVFSGVRRDVSRRNRCPVASICRLSIGLFA